LLPADIIQAIQAPAVQPVYSTASANPAPVLQTGQLIPPVKPTLVKMEFAKFVNDWVPEDIIREVLAGLAFP